MLALTVSSMPESSNGLESSASRRTAKRVDRGWIGDVFTEDHKLITGEACDGVPGRSSPVKSFSDRHQ